MRCHSIHSWTYVELGVLFYTPILHILPGLIEVCYYFPSAGFSTFETYATIGVPVSLFVIPPCPCPCSTKYGYFVCVRLNNIVAKTLVCNNQSPWTPWLEKNSSASPQEDTGIMFLLCNNWLRILNVSSSFWTRMFWTPILHILPGLIEVCYYFPSAGFSTFETYATIGTFKIRSQSIHSWTYVELCVLFYFVKLSL
jgi:hypothetical protein